MSQSLNVPFLDLPAQYATLKDEVRAAVDEILATQLFVLGPEVDAFEAELAEFCDVFPVSKSRTFG